MSKTIKKIALICVAFFALMCSVFATYFMVTAQGSDGDEVDSVIYTFDSDLFVTSAYASTARITSEDGYMRIQSTASNEDGFYCYYEAPQDINSFELSNYRYLKVKLKRENCNGRFQLYFFKKENWVESTLYRCGFSLGSEYDGVWVEIIIDLPVSTTSENAVYIKNLETGETVAKPFSDINPDQNGVSMNNYAGEFSSFRFNLSRGDAGLEKRALMEYMAFFNDFDDAQAYNGSARERLSLAEDNLLRKEHVSEFALSERTEEKIVKLANDYFASELGVSVEVVNYTYQYPTQTEYGYMDCDIRLVSGGLYHFVENIRLNIEPEPTAPIVYQFNDEESINTLLSQGKTSVEAYLYEGVMKMVQLDPLLDDGFWVVLDTVADNNRFLMQSYPIIKYRINVTGQGPSQLFFANYASYYSYAIGYDESVWLTVTFDTAKTTNAVCVLNEETGVVSYYPSLNAVYSEDFTPPAFRGLSDEFRFNFGRRSGLERTALLDYIAFFPTMESAMQYEAGGAKAVTGIQNTLQNGTLEMDYAEGDTKTNAIHSAMLMIEELGKDNFAVRLESVIYTAPVLNEKKGEIRANAVLTDSHGESYTVAVRISIGHYTTSKEQGLYFMKEAVLPAVEKSANTQIAFENGVRITGTAQSRAISVSSLAVADKINLGAYNYLALGVNENYDGEVFFTATTENGAKRFAITPNGKGNTVIELGELTGILNGFSVECTKDMTLRYITFFEREADALSFTGVSNRQQIVNAELAKIENLIIGETPAANCYTEREATAVAKKLLEKTLSEGSRAEVIPVELVKPTKTATGYFLFKVRLALGGTFTSVSAESEVVRLPISKIKRYDYIEENYRFDGESYAESEDTVGEFKTIEVLLKANENDGYIVGDDSFTLLVNAGELQLMSGAQTLFMTQNFNLKSRGLVHIAITVDRQNNKTVLFVDGQKFLETDSTFNANKASALFVAGTPTERVKFNGYISTVRVWESLRTQEQINAYRYDRLLGNENGLLQDWLFDDTDEFVNRANYENSLKLVQIYKNYYHEFTGYDYLKTEQAIAYTPKTVELWLQPFVEKKIECSLIANTLNTTATTGDFRLRLLENGDLQLDYGETRLVVSGVNAYSGTWKHIAFVFADTETRVYLNGELFTTLKAVSGALKATTYYLGGDKTGKAVQGVFVDGNFIGKMANVRFWSTVRTPSELKENAQERLIKESGLLWNLSLDISDNLVFADSVSANNAKIVSESWYKIVNENKGDYFTSVILPDPQDYIVGTVARQGRDWDSYDEWRFYNYNVVINDWIIDNKAKENIEMVITVGDLTQNATRMEFEVFKEHIAVFDDIVPYMCVLGNHDLQSMMGYGSDTRGCSEFNAVFDFDEWSNRSYYGGSFEQGNLDNTYYVVEVKGVKYMVMCLEFLPRDEVLEWADYIAKKHADYKIIVSTHNNLSSKGVLSDGIPNYGLASKDGATTNTGVGMWNKFVKRNPNVIQVISGHVGSGLQYLETTNEKGNTVQHIMADTWSTQINENNKVEGLVVLNRYYDNGEIGVYLYDPNKDCYYVSAERYEQDMSESRGL